jgi:selenocysteine-specific elongation factor
MIVGTAGHIDHGKTALVKALTGIDADTLAEEKRRGITIELGFVFLEAPGSERQVVFIDVPGHEKLIKTMVAGASNIDAALLVIAADEGISVQTREHFDILRLLNIERGYICLTKADLVEEARIEELSHEVRTFVQDTFLADAEIIPVSAVTGRGVEEVRRELLRLAEETKERSDSGVFRMPVDRVFTMSGFGTVVAGTVLSGQVKIGGRVEVYPEKKTSRVRGIQVHHSRVDRSVIGKRTALNLPEIKKEEFYRGQTVALPGTLFPTQRLDGKLHLLKSAEKGLKNRARVRLHVGTAEVISRVVLLDKDILRPGGSGYAQFILEASAVAVPRDRFVIRSFSPVLTMGGGWILDASPRKHKRLDEAVIAGMKRLEGEADEVIQQMSLKFGFFPQTASVIALHMGRSLSKVEQLIRGMCEKGILIEVSSEKGGGDKAKRYIHSQAFVRLQEIIVDRLQNFLEKNPYLAAMPKVELRSQLQRLTDTETFNSAVADLIRHAQLEEKDAKISLVDYQMPVSTEELELARQVEAEFLRSGYKSPLVKEVREKLGIPETSFQNVLSYLYEQGRLLRLDEKVTYHCETLDKAKEFVVEYIRRRESITMAELRDALDFSRKYAQPILEYLDSVGITKRVGDKRVLKP